MRCSICGGAILGKYYYDEWGNKVCACHVDNGEVARCASCGAYVPMQDSTGDGRAMCGTCLSSVVVEREDAERMKRYVVRKLQQVGVEFKDSYLESVNLDIVSPQQMADIRQQPVNPQNKGITITRSLGLIGFGGRMSHHIYMVSYMPRVEFAATLAHEVLHIWQNENGIKLSPIKCEGLCNVGSYLMYEDMQSLRTSFYKKQLLESPDPIYGEGFRLMYALCQKYGYKRFFEMAKSNNL